MRYDEVVTYCLAKPGATPDEPWPEDLVVKVGGKIFAFLGGDDAMGIKCGPTQAAAAEWRERYPDAVSVMAYIGRYGWNSVTLDGTVPGPEVRELIDASYADVVSRLPKSKRPPGTARPLADEKFLTLIS
ncbi:MAG: MmcQ/YjbR family DNA-binding protein [Geodermatophilaceae bacterium]